MDQLLAHQLAALDVTIQEANRSLHPSHLRRDDLEALVPHNGHTALGDLELRRLGDAPEVQAMTQFLAQAPVGAGSGDLPGRPERERWQVMDAALLRSLLRDCATVRDQGHREAMLSRVAVWHESAQARFEAKYAAKQQEAEAEAEAEQKNKNKKKNKDEDEEPPEERKQRPHTAGQAQGGGPPLRRTLQRPFSSSALTSGGAARGDSGLEHSSMAVTGPRRSFSANSLQSHRLRQRHGAAAGGQTERLGSYRKHDLRASHSRRVLANARALASVYKLADLSQGGSSLPRGVLQSKAGIIAAPDVSSALETGAVAPLLQRTEDLQENQLLNNCEPTGFLYHKMETEAEKNLHQIWLGNRRTERVLQRNETEVRRAVESWAVSRSRVEGEILRRQEVRRFGSQLGTRALAVRPRTAVEEKVHSRRPSTAGAAPPALEIKTATAEGSPPESPATPDVRTRPHSAAARPSPSVAVTRGDKLRDPLGHATREALAAEQKQAKEEEGVARAGPGSVREARRTHTPVALPMRFRTPLPDSYIAKRSLGSAKSGPATRGAPPSPGGFPVREEAEGEPGDAAAEAMWATLSPYGGPPPAEQDDDADAEEEVEQDAEFSVLRQAMGQRRAPRLAVDPLGGIVEHAPFLLSDGQPMPAAAAAGSRRTTTMRGGKKKKDRGPELSEEEQAAYRAHRVRVWREKNFPSVADYSEVREQTMAEVDQIEAAFRRRDMSIDGDLLRRALHVPEDMDPEESSLPLPGASLPANPLLAEKNKLKAPAKKKVTSKRSSKVRPSSASASKKKKKTASSSSSSSSKKKASAKKKKVKRK